MHFTWKVSGSTDVSFAIDNASGVYQDHLAQTGSLDVNFPCDGYTHTYYLTAHGTSKSVSAQLTISPTP